MRLKLKSEVLLAVGKGDLPVDLVLRPDGNRVPLNPEEAAVAMFLVDGVPEGEPFLALIRKHGVPWTIAMLNGFMDRLLAVGLVEKVEEPPARVSLAPEPLWGDASDLGEEVDPTVSEAVNVLASRHEESPAAAPPATNPPEEDEWLEPTESWLESSPTPVVQASSRDPLVARSPRQSSDANLPPTQLFPPPVPLFHDAGDGDSTQDQAFSPTLLAPEPARRSQPSRAREGGPGPSLSQKREADRLAPPPAGSPLGQSLAAVAIYIRDRKLEEAEQVLRPLIDQDPTNLHLQAMLELLEKVRALGEGKRRRRWVLLGFLAFLVVALVSSLFLVRIPYRQVLPCQAQAIPLGELRSPIAGRIKTCPDLVGQALEKEQVLVIVEDEARAQQLQDLRRQRENETDLLRIMRTGGTDADEKKQRALIKSATTAKEKGCAARDRRCAARLVELDRELGWARAKLKYLEWTALPEEIKELEQRLDEVGAQIARHSRQPLRAEVSLPWAGIVTELACRKERVSPNDLLARLVHPSRFTVRSTVSPGRGLELKGARVTLTKKNLKVVFQGASVKTEGTRALVEVEAEVTKVLFGGSCQLELTGGRVTLARYLLARLRR